MKTIKCKPFAEFLLLGAALCLMFNACASLEKAAAPYAIYDTEIAEQEVLGVEFAFVNLSGKEIQNVKFFARLGISEDSDFEDCEKEFCFEAAIEAGGAEHVFIPFEEFEFDEGCYVESLYATEIIFEDGTLWQGGGTQQIY